MSAALQLENAPPPPLEVSPEQVMVSNPAKGWRVLLHFEAPVSCALIKRHGGKLVGGRWEFEKIEQAEACRVAIAENRSKGQTGDAVAIKIKFAPGLNMIPESQWEAVKERKEVKRYKLKKITTLGDEDQVIEMIQNTGLTEPLRVLLTRKNVPEKIVAAAHAQLRSIDPKYTH